MSRALFENMSDELRNLSREMSAIEEFKGNVKDVEEVIENINSPLTIMVMGEFSTGKSTFINALMGEAITKVDAKPTTAVITKLVYGERDRIVVHYQDGSAKEYGREEFERLTAEADAQSNEMHERMDYVERTLPIDMLKSMSIIDSPGLNSIKSVHEDMTRHFMDKADTVLWMFDANKPGSQTEIDALKRLNPRLTPLVLVNKIDGIDEEEGDSVEGILEGVERRLENNKIEAQGYLGISAKMAFKGRTENRDNLVQASNIGAFYDAIEEKVLPGREQYKRNSLLDGLVKMSYGVGSHIKELREKNEERKGSDYAAYVAMETELATVWDELENITDIMLTDIEKNQPQGRKRLNAAMKAFYGMIHWLGIFVEQDDEVAKKYLEEAAVRGDGAAQRVLVDWLWSKGAEEAAEYWIERIGFENIPSARKWYLEKGKQYKVAGAYKNALKYYSFLAEMGDVQAMYMLGEMYENGDGFEQDYKKAIEWYSKAFQDGMEMLEGKLDRLYREEFEKNRFRITVVGEFSTGKSSFINALIGKRILPTRHRPTTTICTKITYGYKPKYVALYRGKRQEVIDEGEFKSLVSEWDDDFDKGIDRRGIMRNNIEFLDVRYPIEFCKEYVEIIDTPGTMNLIDYRYIVNNYLETSDVIVLMMNSYKYINSDMAYIRTLVDDGMFEKLLIVFNYMDYFDEDEVDSQLVKCILKGGLPKDYDWDKRIFVISARQALNYRRNMNGEELSARILESLPRSIEETGILDVEKALRTFREKKWG